MSIYYVDRFGAEGGQANFNTCLHGGSKIGVSILRSKWMFPCLRENLKISNDTKKLLKVHFEGLQGLSEKNSIEGSLNRFSVSRCMNFQNAQTPSAKYSQMFNLRHLSIISQEF